MTHGTTTDVRQVTQVTDLLTLPGTIVGVKCLFFWLTVLQFNDQVLTCGDSLNLSQERLRFRVRARTENNTVPTAGVRLV